MINDTTIEVEQNKDIINQIDMAWLSSIRINIVLDVSEQNGNRNLRRAQMREMPLRRDHLDDGLAAEVAVDVLRDGHRHRQVLGALNYVAGHGDARQETSEVEGEDGPEHTQGYVGSDVEQRPTELLHRHGVHVAADHQWRKPRDPRFVVWLHCLTQLINIFLLKPAVVIISVYKP